MAASLHAGDVLAERYQMVDLLRESEGGWFWCAQDAVLRRQVAIHLIPDDDDRAEALMTAARRSAALVDRRNLRVLDADRHDGLCYVVNEWGQGVSLDSMLADEGPLPARQAAWLVAEVADTLAVAHSAGRAHGRLYPESVLVDENGQVRIIGFAVDAALHGLPADRREQDVRDLVAVLYAALTGRWPGPDGSSVPPAPREHGHPLRPRQVRAGIPRALDQICDEVLGHRPQGRNGGGRTLSHLGHRPTHDLHTAAGVRDALEEFLGDVATGSTTLPVEGAPQVEGQQKAEPASAKVSTNGHAPVAPARSSTTDLPTEAGMPVFHDDEQVEWLRARGNPPTPPPALEEPAARPLFAPDPEDGTPVRRPRAPRPAPDQGAEYWPWDTSAGPGPGATHGGGSSGHLPVVPPARQPGRRWLRLAWVIGLSALILLTVVAAYQLGGGGAGSDDEEPDEPSGAPPSAQVTPHDGVTATDFDPEGSPPRDENPELVPYAVDGDPNTSWITSSYLQQFGPGGLKSGVGLTLDLGTVKDVRLVEISVSGGSTSAEVYLGEEAPTDVSGLEPVGSGTDEETISVELDEAQQARYVTVWLTALPPVDSDFRGEIREVVVSG
ncbi:hypothetical protein [Nocardioides campestrisoli]|uniref:hypothetical protein n=1 Tax=Nocardioides campestrisoli TaxID=2736757 RepID=UPI00163D4DB1|nr:hypothetical protein [Nocardioides campestrisoli]